MPRRTTKRKKNDSSMPLEDPQGTTASKPVQPEETQGLPEESREEAVSVDYKESDVDEREPTPAMPVESAHTTPSSVPRGRQEDEESDIFCDDRSDTCFWRDERPKLRSFSEDEAEAEAYFKQYVTSTFHPDDKTADNKIRVIYPLVKPPESITICRYRSGNPPRRCETIGGTATKRASGRCMLRHTTKPGKLVRQKQCFA
jgi:hypothetical protein